MKKIIALVLVMLLALTCMAGCGAKKDDNVLVMATNAEFPPYEYMEDGKIVGKGTHTELMANCETYREIAESQLGGDSNEE